MSRTRKDSSQGSYIDVIQRDGRYDLFRNRELVGEHMEEPWLRELLCVRFGYCQGEDDLILADVERHGRTRRNLSS